jgi:hypothetical protein
METGLLRGIRRWFLTPKNYPLRFVVKKNLVFDKDSVYLDPTKCCALCVLSFVNSPQNPDPHQGDAEHCLEELAGGLEASHAAWTFSTIKEMVF